MPKTILLRDRDSGVTSLPLIISARARLCVGGQGYMLKRMQLIRKYFLNRGKYGWDFSDNSPKAEVSFSQISIQFFIAGL